MATVFKKVLRGLFRRPCLWVTRRLLAMTGLPYRLEQVELGQQMQTVLQLRRLYGDTSGHVEQPLDINKQELKVYSQHGEDGILLYLFSKVGTTNRFFVEFGVQDGRQCNTANLSIHFGWRGLLMDDSEPNVLRGREYYECVLQARVADVRFVHAWVTRENIDSLLRENGVAEEIDLLSIDIDGNDYWVWEAITVTRPRVVVIEYNATLGEERAIITRYDPRFDCMKKHPSGFYHGASLAALTKLARAKGYVLVGCDSFGVNAFYVRRDVAEGKLSEVSVRDAYYPHLGRLLRNFSTAEQFDQIRHLDFESV